MREILAHKKTVSRLAIIVAVLIPISLTFYFVISYGSNVPRWDEWMIVQYYRETVENGFSLMRLLTFQDNEHRIILPVLVQTGIWALTGGNDNVVLVVSQSCLVAAFLLIVLYWKKENHSIVGLLPIPVLIFSMKQGMLTFWPSCIMWPLMVLFAVASFYCFYLWTRLPKKKYIGLAVLFAVGATFCAAGGLLIWIAYIALFIAQSGFEKKRLFTKENVVFLPIALLCFWFYLTDWNRTTSAYTAKNPVDFLKAMVENIACFACDEQQKIGAILLGTLLFIAFFLCGCYVCARKKITLLVFPLLIAGFFFGNIIAIAYARGGMGAFNNMGTEVVLSSQYSMMPTWFVIGVLLVLYEILCPLKGKRWCVLCSCLLYGILLLVSLSKVYVAKTYATLHQACAYIVQNYECIPEDNRLMYVYPEDITSDVRWIKEQQLFLFGENKVYSYPYNDLQNTVIEPSDILELPDIKAPPGIYWIDHINNIPISDQINIQADDGVALDFWALDSDHKAAPAAVWVEFADRYYQLNVTQSPGVAEFYHEDAYKNCGYRGSILTDNLPGGTYTLKLIVILASHDAYYEVPITNITISENG